jgi:hypothetical protein
LSEVFHVDLAGTAAFSAATHDAEVTIKATGSADPAAMLRATANGLGPIGDRYLAAYARAQANYLAAKREVEHVYGEIGRTTCETTAAVVRHDTA